MKYLISLFIISSLLSGCGSSVVEDAELKPKLYSGDSVYVFTDTKTGCEYFIYAKNNKGGITARLNSDGKPICSDKQ